MCLCFFLKIAKNASSSFRSTIIGKLFKKSNAYFNYLCYNTTYMLKYRYKYNLDYIKSTLC